MKNNKQNKAPKSAKPFSGTISKLSREGGTFSPRAISEIAKGKLQSSVKTMKPKSGFLKNLATMGGNFLKSAAPDLVGLIPGVGPLAKTLLSTMNDDEWFSEFGAAGATFNELNSLQAKDDDNTWVRGIAATMHFPMFINEASTVFLDQMPSILAYVRNKAQNILMDDVTQYTKAFIAAVKLYGIYYTGKKYVMLSENQPLNIPMLYRDCFALTPAIYSAFAGMIENLGQYLKTSVRLPYALVEYIRWRCGTTFYSANTGKPGLVFYDYVPALASDSPWSFRTLGTATADNFIAKLGDMIEEARASYISAGRAGADLKLAYEDHQIRYDVEKPHYDEKEFCLRANVTPWYESANGQTLVTSKHPGTDSSVDLYMDSRLDSSAALQAVTISTGLRAFFCVQQPIVAWYLPVAKQLSYVNAESQPDTLQILQGWHSARVHYNARTASYQPLYSSGYFCCVMASGATIYGYENPALDNTEASFRHYLIYVISNLILDSMQQHAAGQYVTVGSSDSPMSIVIAQLAFDRAVIPTSQLESIQRICLRNLVRGTYKQKAGVTPAATEAATQVADLVVEELEKTM